MKHIIVLADGNLPEKPNLRISCYVHMVVMQVFA
jgi:hypothetical protein